MKNKILISILILPILIGIASACSCIYFENTEAKYNNAQYVFSGKLVELQQLESYPVQYKANFQVDKIYKNQNNEIKDKIVINSVQDSGANCGYNFEQDKEYLIYAYIDQDTKTLHTNSCMGSSIIENAEEEIQELEKIANPTIPEKSEDQEKSIFSKFFNWLKSLFN